jgi:hypothetical protein
MGGVPDLQCNIDLEAATFKDKDKEDDTMEHESLARKRRARRKREVDSAHKLRRSTRLMAKEEPNFKLPAAKAARVQTAKFDYSGVSRRLCAALARSKLLSDPTSPSSDDSTLVEIAAACGATDEEQASVKGVTALTL